MYYIELPDKKHYISWYLFRLSLRMDPRLYTPYSNLGFIYKSPSGNEYVIWNRRGMVSRLTRV